MKKFDDQVEKLKKDIVKEEKKKIKKENDKMEKETLSLDEQIEKNEYIFDEQEKEEMKKDILAEVKAKIAEKKAILEEKHLSRKERSKAKKEEKKEKEETREEKEETREEKEESTFKEKFQKILNKLHSKKSILNAVLIIIPVCFLLSIIAFMFCNKISTKVYSNVYLENVDFSKMTAKEVEKNIIKIYEENPLEAIVEIYQGEKLIDSIIADDIDFEVDVAATKKQMLDHGRDKDIFSNNLKIFSGLFNKTNFKFKYEYDEQKFDEAIEFLSTTMDGKAIDDKFEIDEAKRTLVITVGKKGKTVDKEDLKKEVIKLLEKQEAHKYVVKEIESMPKSLDLNEVSSKVKRNAQDAAVINVEGKIPEFRREIVGYDYNDESLKSELDKAENKVEGKIIDYKLTVIEPKVKYRDIAWQKYEDVLGAKTTTFAASNVPRSTNLRIALKNINGTIIMPGEVFSYNKAVGPINEANGFRPAGIFKNGTVATETGGGVCQTVSTLYNAVLSSNLQVIERKRHGLFANYVPASLDATIYQYAYDFKFKNTRNYPVKISTWYANGSLGVKIMGTKEEDDCDIILSSRVLQTIPFTTTEVQDPTLAKGTKVVKVGGCPGYVSESYKIYKKNGATIKTELITKDTYKPTNKVINVGTRE
ncbi:MAG: VanW family protein [Clostridia bacterium]